MIEPYWLLAAFIAGVLVGVVAVSLMVMARGNE